MILTIAVSPFVSIGQTLDELLVVLEESNLALQAMDFEYKAGLERAQQVSQMPDPEFSMGVYALPVETRLGPQWVKLGARQTLPWKGKLKSKEDLEIAKATPILQAIEARRLELEEEVRLAFYQLYKLEKSSAIIEKSIQIFEILESSALSKVEAGRASLADVLLVQRTQKELNSRLEVIDQRKPELLSMIGTVLNVPVRELELKFADLEPAVLPIKKDSLLNIVGRDHPAVLMHQQLHEISESELKVNQMERKPTFTVGLDYVFVTGRTDAEPKGNGRDILMPNASVIIPFNKKKYAAKEREEHMKMASHKLHQEAIITRFQSRIEKIYSDYSESMVDYNLIVDQKELTNSIIEIKKSQYISSGEGFDELLLMQNDLVNYEFRILEEIVETHLAAAELQSLFDF